MYMRHTKKNRKQRRNGKNKQRFSKKGGDFGILRGLVNTKDAFKSGISSVKDAVKSGVSSAATTVTNKINSATSAFQNTPLGKLNWALKMRNPNTVTAETINGITLEEYNKIQWKDNEKAISSDGLEALLQLASEYARVKDKKYITDVKTLKTLKASKLLDNKVNNVNNEEIETKNIANEIERISNIYVLNQDPNAEDNIKGDIKELFKLILQKGNKTQLIDFSKEFTFFKDFDYEEKFNDNTTPLLVAASNKSPEILNHILTDKEIKDNISFEKDSKNNSVIHVACTNNNPNILKVLFTKANTQTGGDGWFSSSKIQDKPVNVFKPNAIDDEIFDKITSLINEKNNADELPIDIICDKPITKINGESIKLLLDNGSKFFEANKLLSGKLKTLDNEINAINGEINKQTVKVSVKTNSLKNQISQKEVEKQKYQEVIKPITDKINSIKESEKENIIKIDANKQKAMEIALKITNTKFPPVSSLFGTAGSPFVLADFTDGSTILNTPKTKSGILDTKQYPTQDQLDYFKKESEAQLYLIPDKVIDKILELYPSQSDKERTIDPNYDNTITAIVETKPVQTNSETNPETDLKDTKIETNENTPQLVQGGRRRVTKRLQHNLRRYRL